MAPKFLSPTPDSYISCLLNVLNRCLTPTKSEVEFLIPVHPYASSSPVLCQPLPSGYRSQKPGRHPRRLFLSPPLTICQAISWLCLQNSPRAHHLSPRFPASCWSLCLHPCPLQSLLSTVAAENGGLLCSECPHRSPSHSEGKPKTLQRPRGPACPLSLCLPRLSCPGHAGLLAEPHPCQTLSPEDVCTDRPFSLERSFLRYLHGSLLYLLQIFV